MLPEGNSNSLHWCSDNKDGGGDDDCVCVLNTEIKKKSNGKNIHLLKVKVKAK